MTRLPAEHRHKGDIPLLIGDLETHLTLVTDVRVERLAVQRRGSIIVQVDTRTVALDKLIARLRPS
jgi:hypothetical protein